MSEFAENPALVRSPAFVWSRFWRVLVLYIRSQGSYILGVPASMVLMFAFVPLVAFTPTSGMRMMSTSFFYIALLMGFFFNALFISRDFNVPGGRQRFIHLPASMAEKFAVKMALCLIIGPLLLIFTTIIAATIVEAVILQRYAQRIESPDIWMLIRKMPLIWSGTVIFMALGIRSKWGIALAVVWIVITIRLVRFPFSMSTETLSVYEFYTRGIKPTAAALPWMTLYGVALTGITLLFGATIYFLLKEKEV